MVLAFLGGEGGEGVRGVCLGLGNCRFWDLGVWGFGSWGIWGFRVRA